MKTPLITAIVSTYSAERFMKGCLDDLVAQTAFEDVEVLVIDSGSPERESAITAQFVDRHDNIRLLRTEREGLYATWNRAIDMARGKYLTSANTDDRHRRDAFEQLAARLDSQPDAALAYGDQYVSPTENETFEECEARGARLRRWPEFTPADLMLRCITGSQPMWRRTLHATHGVFDTRYRIAADYELWMRFAQGGNFSHIAVPLGVFYDSPATLSGSGNRWLADTESLQVRQTYLSQEPWSNDRSLRPRLAQVLFSIGYWYIEHASDPVKAKPFLRAAWKLDPLNAGMAKTYLLRGVLGSRWCALKARVPWRGNGAS